MRCDRLAGPIAGGEYLAVRVASDRDLENAGAQGSESRTAEESCGFVYLCTREEERKKSTGTTLAACLGEVAMFLSHVTRGPSSC